MKKILIFTTFVLFTGFTAHKYYVSVTEVNIKSGKLEIIIRTFPDDIQNTLSDLYHLNARLENMDESSRKFIKLYLLEHFQLRVDNQEIPYRFSGFVLQDGFLVILLEAGIPEDFSTIQLKNTILMDSFDEQKNIVHFLDGKRKESFILTKNNRIAIYTHP